MLDDIMASKRNKAPKQATEAQSDTTVVRVPRALLARAEALAVKLTDHMGVEVTASAVVKAALEKGLDALDRAK